MSYDISVSMRAFLAIGVSAVLTPLFAQSTPGTSLTFENRETWEVPGAVLKPGTYTIRVKDSMFDREILTVTDASNKVRSTFIATAPLETSTDSVEGQFSFWPAAPGKNRIVRAWVGNAGGSSRQFTYPKEKAVEIANASRESVPAIDPASDTRLHHGGNSDEDRKIVQLWLLTATDVAPGKPAIEAKKFEPRNVQMASAASSTAPALSASASASTPVDAPVAPVRARRSEATAPQRQEASAAYDSSPSPRKMPDTATDTPAMLLAGTMCLVMATLLLVFKQRLS